MRYDFVDNLLLLCQQNYDISYLRLISYLADSYDRRDYMVGKGLMDIIEDLLTNVEKLETEENFLTLNLVQNLITTHKIDENTVFPPKK